jgi:hypothetical protein
MALSDAPEYAFLWAVEARDEAQIAPWMCAFSVFSHNEIHSFRV